MRGASVSTIVLITAIALAKASNAAELPIYAAIGASWGQTNSLASTDARVPGFPPTELQLDGQAFDDDDFGWTAALGYQFTDYFAIELGYESLGTFQGKAPLIGFSGISGTLPAPVHIEPSGLFLASQFSLPLADRLQATWHFGVVRAEFDAIGSTPVGVFAFPPADPPGTVFIVPFADPANETGYFFGFGIRWRFSRHFDAELAYSRQDLQVLEFDSVGLRLVGRLKP